MRARSKRAIGHLDQVAQQAEACHICHGLDAFPGLPKRAPGLLSVHIQSRATSPTSSGLSLDFFSAVVGCRCPAAWSGRAATSGRRVVALQVARFSTDAGHRQAEDGLRRVDRMAARQGNARRVADCTPAAG